MSPDDKAAPAETMLEALARDIADYPERVQAVDANFVRRIQLLIGGVEVDLEAPLLAEDE